LKLNRILLARTDRLGDAVLITPAIRAVKTSFPQAAVTVLAAAYARPVFERSPWVDQVLVYDPVGRHRGLRGLVELTDLIRSSKPDVAVHFFPAPMPSAASFLAGVPLRVGTAYRLWSFLYNVRVKQHRSKCEKHEAEYNLELLGPLGVEAAGLKPEVFVSDASRRRMALHLEALGVRRGEKIVVIHPGSGGSALAWPVRRFAELVREIAGSRMAVPVVVGTEPEAAIGREVVGPSAGRAIDLAGRTSLDELAALLSLSDAFVGNSSGPLHLATAVSTPVVGLFSPVKAQGPRRWGPLGEGHLVLSPPLEECLQCPGEKCSRFNCMDLIETAQVLGALGVLLGRSG